MGTEGLRLRKTSGRKPNGDTAKMPSDTINRLVNGYRGYHVLIPDSTPEEFIRWLESKGELFDDDVKEDFMDVVE